MDPARTTWVVAFDARQARFFVEPARSGPLREIRELRMSATEEERGAGGLQRATVHSRAGAGRSAAGDRNLAHAAEARFLRRVATRLMVAGGRGDFDHLALMGPPHALGALRKALPAGVAARVEVTDPHARVHEDADAMRQILREARAHAWRAESA
ncbi:MAG: host attachment protein [Phenylobacterium sp.]|uniref:host attachment protein n=1 Tax=Phenylobacterium sp. TaxID=1871053 RepID=UPI001A50E796|nr:host attachment protein [Phenylobacterium sp.]MBL8770901.1 host attachment protein [Phenylobacterium sp.]